jgi:A/G-specific adenine glycosylase
MDEPALDGNLKRVYARLFDVGEPVDSSEGEKILWGLARDNLPKGRAGDYNQALMDLGAIICLPRNPRCLICPLMEVCKARENGTQEQRPVMKPKKDIPHYVHVAGVFVAQVDNLRYKVLLAKRPSKGLLGGMWEFPNGRVVPKGDVDGDPAKELVKLLKTEYNLRLRVKRSPGVRKIEPIGIFRHTYTHFKVTVHVFECELLPLSKNENLKWIPIKALGNYPMGKVDRQIAQVIMQRNRT